MIANTPIFNIIESYKKSEDIFNNNQSEKLDILSSLFYIQLYCSENNIFINTKVYKNRIYLTFNETKVINFVGLLTIFNLFGLNINEISINDTKNTKIFTITEFKYNLTEEYFRNILEINIILEPENDILFKLNTNVVYHVIDENNLNSVLENGIISNDLNKIYLNETIEEAKEYIKRVSKYDSNYKKVYKILKIDITNLNLMIYLYSKYENVYYTLDNINKSLISIYQ
jgi:hypothetical protein